jgi:hypothetical protein
MNRTFPKFNIGQHVTFSKKVTGEIDRYKQTVIDMIKENPYVTITHQLDDGYGNQNRYRIFNRNELRDSHVWTEEELMVYIRPNTLPEELFTI